MAVLVTDSNGLVVIFFDGKMKYVVGLVIFPLSVSCNDFVSCLYSTGNGMINNSYGTLSIKAHSFVLLIFSQRSDLKKTVVFLRRRW